MHYLVLASWSDISYWLSSRCHTIVGRYNSVYPPELHPHMQIWSLLASEKQDGDSHNAKL